MTKRQSSNLAKLLLVFFALAFVLVACLEKPPGEREFKILDKTFVLPAESKSGRYWQKEIPSFVYLIDAETYQSIPDADETKLTRVRIEVMPLKLGKQASRAYYWTEKDPILRSKESNCKDYQQKYKICESAVEPKGRIVWGSAEGYSIKNKSNGEYEAVIACMPESQLPNDLCFGRTVFLDNLQIRYRYNIKYQNKKLEIHEKVKTITSSFLQ